MKNACYHAQIVIHANFVVCEEIHKIFNYFTKDNPCSGGSEDYKGVHCMGGPHAYCWMNVCGIAIHFETFFQYCEILIIFAGIIYA